MMTSSNGNIFRVTGPLWGNSPVPVNSPHKGQWCGALMFSLISIWINGWVNNREAGDLRRYRDHYDVRSNANASTYSWVCMQKSKIPDSLTMHMFISRFHNTHWYNKWSPCYIPSRISGKSPLAYGRFPDTMCNIRYPSEIHLKLKSREISFAHNSCFSWPIDLRFCTEHGSITTVLCAKLQTDWTIEKDVMDERDFASFEFKMGFGRISYIAEYSRIRQDYVKMLRAKWNVIWRLPPINELTL